jgi:DNA-binding NtrC family response regulator
MARPRCGRSSKSRDSRRPSALILGESGTGKELIARLFHSLDPRPDKGNLVVVDCTTIVPDLSAASSSATSAGHSPAPAARAMARSHWRAAAPCSSTKLANCRSALQAQLLRAVQEQTFKRVGGNTWFKADFRLVCATNRDLQAAVQRGEFRHDLYHRIANWIVHAAAPA